MLSWNDEPQTFGKMGSMGRTGSLTRSGGGAGSPTVGSPGARRSVELNARRSIDAGGASSPAKHSPLVKEGQRFSGWSHFVDNSHLNVIEPAEDKPTASNLPAASEPAKTQVGFDAPQQVQSAPTDTSAPAPSQASLPTSTGGAPAAGSEVDSKGWWKKMDQGALNMKHVEDNDAKAPSSFTPQFAVTGQNRDLDWDDKSGDSKKNTEWDPFKGSN